jgi:hypothetical protein
MLLERIHSVINDMLEVEARVRELTRLVDWLAAHDLPCEHARGRLSEFQRALRDDNAALERLTDGISPGGARA